MALGFHGGDSGGLFYQTYLIKPRHDRNEFSVYLQKLNDSKYLIKSPSPNDVNIFGLELGGSSVGNALKWLTGYPTTFYNLLIDRKWGNFDNVRSTIGESIVTLMKVVFQMIYLYLILKIMITKQN